MAKTSKKRKYSLGLFCKTTEPLRSWLTLQNGFADTLGLFCKTAISTGALADVKQKTAVTRRGVVGGSKLFCETVVTGNQKSRAEPGA